MTTAATTSEPDQKLPPPRSPLEGVSVVPITPMTTNGAVDLPSLDQLVAATARAGVTSFMAAGHTGEFYSLSLDEWEAVVGTVRDAVGPAVHVLAAIGHDLHNACVTASMARRLGCDGILIHQPPHPVFNARGFLEYVSDIVQECGLPAVLYLTTLPLATAVASHIDTVEGVIGVKWGVPDMDGFLQATDQPGTHSSDITWICGLGERWAQRFYASGVAGYTSGLANVQPELVLRFHAAIAANDREGVALMWPSISRFELLRSIDGGSVTVIKAALSRLGRCGSTVRPPLGAPDSALFVAVDEILRSWDLDSLPDERLAARRDLVQ